MSIIGFLSLGMKFLMCGTKCSSCQVNAVNLPYLVYMLAVLLTVLDVADMLALSILFLCSFSNSDLLNCLKTVQKSFFVKEAYDTTFIMEELMALECCCSLSTDLSGIHNHIHLPSTYRERIGIRPEKAKFSAVTVITVGFEICSSQQPLLERH